MEKCFSIVYNVREHMWPERKSDSVDMEVMTMDLYGKVEVQIWQQKLQRTAF